MFNFKFINTLFHFLFISIIKERFHYVENVWKNQVPLEHVQQPLRQYKKVIVPRSKQVILLQVSCSILLRINFTLASRSHLQTQTS